MTSHASFQIGPQLKGVFLVIVLSAATPLSAAAAIKVPDCDAFAAWAAKLDKKDRWQPNSSNKKLWLPAIYHGPEFEALFGKPALEWTQTDVKAAVKQTKTCGRQAHKAKRGDEVKVFRTIRSSLSQRLPGLISGVDRSKRELDQHWKALLALPASRDALRVFGALRRMGPGGVLEQADRRALWDDASARGVATRLRELPDEATEALRPTINERYESLRGPVVESLQQDLSASPATLEGLNGLQTTLETTRKELGQALKEEDYAALDETAATRRNEIEEALLAKEVAAIEAAPQTLQGITVITTILEGPAAAALTNARADSLRSAGFERRKAIGDALIDAEIAKLSDIPGTLEGLHQLEAFERQTLSALDEQRTGLSLTGFKHAVVNRFATLGKEAFSDYEKAIAALPENEKGLKALGSFEARNASVIQRIRRSTREQYKEASDERRETIEKAVERENARLAALPLRGGVFVQRNGPRFEFRNNSRVYMTMIEDVTVEGEYEVDGDRVIIRVPQGNMVFSRSGPWLKGQGMELKRQPES